MGRGERLLTAFVLLALAITTVAACVAAFWLSLPDGGAQP